jgi:putative DNA primase/helicase
MIPADAIERARQADLLSEAMRLGARLKRIGGGEYAGPCPACGGGDRFSVNTRKKCGIAAAAAGAATSSISSSTSRA